MSEPDGAEPFLGIAQSLTGRFWRQRTHDDRAALAFAQRLGVPEIVGRVLAGRGVSLDEGPEFLDPVLKRDLPDPSLLLDADAAAARLAEAIQTGETVALFGDYDVDGATSAALFERYFRAAGGQLMVYIPDRLTEGYGPNEKALLALRAQGASVVITVDCGTTSFEPLEAAAKAGLDVIVVDHHQAEPALPGAHAVVNPNRLDQATGWGQLAAVGVAFLVVVALNRALREAGWFGVGRAEPDLRQWLDLVALGTICDVVPLTGVNRALVCQGLKVLGQRGNTGLVALAEVAGLEEAPGVYHAGFVFGPRINAGGRVGQADLGARLLATTDRDEARALAERLHAFNAERQAIEATVQAKALAQVEARLGKDEPGPLLVAAGEGWHPGVIGIVASRLKDRFRRPTVVFGVADGVAKGSGRSLRGVDLGNAVIAARQAGLLVNGGGHAMAAGMTAEADKLPELEAFLTDRLATQVGEAVATNTLGIDGALSVRAAHRGLYETLDKAGPFGAGNAEPRVVVTGARIVEAKVVGAGHVSCVLSGLGGGRLKGIAFRSLDGPLGRNLLEHGGRSVHVAGHLRADNWRGRAGVQLIVEDAAWA